MNMNMNMNMNIYIQHIRIPPQPHNTCTPPMAHAWGGSVMIVVMCWRLGLLRQLGEHLSVIQG